MEKLEAVQDDQDDDPELDDAPVSEKPKVKGGSAKPAAPAPKKRGRPPKKGKKASGAVKKGRPALDPKKIFHTPLFSRRM